MSTKQKPIKKTRLEELSEMAMMYGERSFDNYAQIRSVAEAIRNGMCAYMGSDDPCVFLVPPQGPFLAKNYGSGAFSVSGKGFLPLEPISFGLSVQVSTHGDYMRLVIHCRKEGERIFLKVEEELSYDIKLPLQDEDLENTLEGLYQYLLNWFSGRVERYDHGNYGVTDIGFDIQRVETNETSETLEK